MTAVLVFVKWWLFADMTLTAYLLPLVIAWYRRVSRIGSLAMINIALGWTAVGWVVALAKALRGSPAAASPGPPVPVPPRAPGQAPPLQLPPRRQACR
jgi:hypothetical protein